MDRDPPSNCQRRRRPLLLLLATPPSATHTPPVRIAGRQCRLPPGRQAILEKSPPGFLVRDAAAAVVVVVHVLMYTLRVVCVCVVSCGLLYCIHGVRAARVCPSHPLETNDF